MEAKIKMIAAATKALNFLRKNPKSIDSEVLQYVSDYILSENIKDYSIKFAMIAAATETYNIFMKESKLSDKEILKKVMLRIPEIINTITAIK
jgi:hypothetical protein